MGESTFSSKVEMHTTLAGGIIACQVIHMSSIASLRAGIRLNQAHCPWVSSGHAHSST